MTEFKHSITRKILYILLCSGGCVVLLILFFYAHRQKVYSFILKNTYFYIETSEEFASYIDQQAEIFKGIHLLDMDKSEKELLEDILSERDPYTELDFVDPDTRKSILSYDAKGIDASFTKLYFAGMDLFPDNRITKRTVHFQDATADLEIRTYIFPHFVEIYFLVCSVICIAIVLFPVLFFIRRKMKQLTLLCNDISTISLGNLDYPVTRFGKDEIGLLARQLDEMRSELQKSIRQEQEVHFQNRELISSLSHDLRTPLTILNGYLEIIHHSEDLNEKNRSYLKRSIGKIDEIRRLSDKLFEYAVIYEDFDSPQLETVSSFYVTDLMQQHMEFLGFEGFEFDVRAAYSTQDHFNLTLNRQYLHRIFNNLFSNLQKYGDKHHPVQIEFSICQNHWRISITNKICNTEKTAESNQIGLKSTEKMIQKMNGTFHSRLCDDYYTTYITFPIHD